MLNMLTKKYIEIFNAIDVMKKSEKGQTLVEYALLLLLIAIVVIAAVTFIGKTTNNVYCKMGGALT